MYAAVYPVVASNTHYQAPLFYDVSGWLGAQSCLSPERRSKEDKETAVVPGVFNLKSVIRSRDDLLPNFVRYCYSTTDPRFSSVVC